MVPKLEHLSTSHQNLMHEKTTDFLSSLQLFLPLYRDPLYELRDDDPKMILDYEIEEEKKGREEEEEKKKKRRRRREEEEKEK